MTRLTICVYGEPDGAGRQHFTMYWRDYRGARAQVYHANLDAVVERERRTGAVVAVNRSTTEATP